MSREKSMTEATKALAQCECGALALHIEGAPVAQLVCHCSDCRAFSGMPYVEVAFFEPDACSADGQVSSTTMKGGTGSDKTHYSCAICKTPLYARVTALNGAWAVMANRISSFKFEPQAHIWTSEKADDVLIPEGITQTSERPPNEIVDTMVSSFWGEK
jgi:hypothetical protein